MSHDEELDKELRFHIDERTDELIASGVAPGEARRQARLEFGGVTQTREAVRDQHVFPIVDGLLQDLRLGCRTLRATPVVTAVAVLSLALGIGANTAIFSIVDSLVLRALPVSEPQQLATITGGLGPTSTWTYPIWTEIQRRVVVGVALSAWASMFVASLLYGLEPRDPVTLVGAALLLGAVGAIAGWLPAHRASRIDPAVVLRDS
jgi:hypothetical protein